MKKTLIVAVALAATGLIRADVTPLVGTNTVGYAVVTNVANQGSTIITVPFEACLNNGAAGVLTDLVSTNGLVSDSSNPAHADQLVVLTTNDTGLIYYYYWLQTGTGWTGVGTTVLMPGGTNGMVTPPAANTFQIARGLGFWLKRYAYGSESTVVVKGQVSTNNQSTEITHGLNLIGFASPAALRLNEDGIVWTGAYGSADGVTDSSDKVLIVGPNGTFTQYFYFTLPAAWASDPTLNAIYGPLNGKWIDQNYYVATNATVHAGQGFWYVRRGITGFTFQPGL